MIHLLTFHWEVDFSEASLACVGCFGGPDAALPLSAALYASIARPPYDKNDNHVMQPVPQISQPDFLMALPG